MATAGVEDLVPLSWATANFVLPGNIRSGDLFVANVWRQGALLAAIDGIGHGDEAHAAAQIARSVLDSHPAEPLVTLVQRCHEVLRGTRGVVMSLVTIDVPHGLLSWLGVGNVRVLLVRSADNTAPYQELMLRSGVVGAQLPRLESATLPFSQGDTLVFATDGIHSDFADRISTVIEPQVLARNIMTGFCHGNDDALVLVARLG